MLALKILTQHRIRITLTSLSVACCALLMLFLASIYQGVSYGSVEYVRASDADFWILQDHATNILRSTSILPAMLQEDLEAIDGVASVSKVVFMLASVTVNGVNATLYLTGIDPATGMGGPPVLVEGRNIQSSTEIVLDKAFAAKYRVRVGDLVRIRDDSLRVTGLSTGTNMFVIQYAFVSLNEVYGLIGITDVVSCFQVRARRGSDLAAVKKGLESSFKHIAVYSRDAFVRNNVREMESGLLPLIGVVTIISAIVMTAILSLILSVSVLEKRRDLAIMKAIGAPGGFIAGLVIRQSVVLSLAGLVTALLLFAPMTALIERVAPEVSTRTSVWTVVAVAAVVLAISLVSVVLPSRWVRRIYPLEVFAP